MGATKTIQHQRALDLLQNASPRSRDELQYQIRQALDRKMTLPEMAEIDSRYEDYERRCLALVALKYADSPEAYTVIEEILKLLTEGMEGAE